MTIHNELTELQALLDQEHQILAQMENAMQSKKECLVTNNTPGLMKTDQALMALGQRTAQLEQKRMELLRQMGFADHSLEQLVASLGAQYPEQVRPLRESRLGLRRVMERIQALNRNNQELLALSIQWIESTVELIARQVNPEAASYTANGQKKQNRKQGAEALNIQSTVIHDA